MSAKKWTILFVCLMLLSLLFIAGTNFIIDPYGYFGAKHGENYTMDENDYLREQKAEHIKYHADDYDAYLVGGSKAGGIRSEKLSDLDGYRYYNCWLLSGNFEDYYLYSKFIIETAHPKKLLLHISTSEIAQFDREAKGDIYEVPAVISEESKTAETFKYLFKNLSVSVETITDKEERFPVTRSGERNLSKYYNYYREHRDANEYYNHLMKEMVDAYLPRLTTGTKDKADLVNSNMDYLKKIKKLCDKNGVEFQVFLGTLFVGEIVGYEGNSFYNWLAQMVEITGGLWCFNNFNDLMYNPFNYYNARHYYYEMGDLMIDRMSGKETGHNDFGIYLTNENIAEEITRRKRETDKLREYYKKTGTIPFSEYEEANNITKDSIYWKHSSNWNGEG
ncbi:MAG: hypothetical protein HFG32_10675 [Eubacterium sp.]|nr:hypothetical protein [Eubacterium sp.]